MLKWLEWLRELTAFPSKSPNNLGGIKVYFHCEIFVPHRSQSTQFRDDMISPLLFWFSKDEKHSKRVISSGHFPMCRIYYPRECVAILSLNFLNHNSIQLCITNNSIFLFFISNLFTFDLYSSINCHLFFYFFSKQNKFPCSFLVQLQPNFLLISNWVFFEIKLAQ